MSPPETLCAHCPHTKGQHDEDGFCEQEMPDSGFCTCSGYDDKEDDVEGSD